MKSFFYVLIVSLVTVIHAQAYNVTGKVVLSTGEPSIAANIILINAADSQSVKFSTTDEEGKYVFDNVNAGTYYISAEEYGYAITNSQVFTISNADITVADILIETTISEELKSVDIVYRRPIIELKPDMTVFNVDSTINSVGLDALELLRKSPGVVVDKDENISLNGKSGLIVMIDGRITPMSGKELGDYLKSIPSNTIDKIELISNPSAKYDAAGNAGIINIRLKKNNNVGFHGSANIGYSVGVYSRYDGGINFNRRSDKTNIFGSYSYRTGNHWSNENFQRDTPDSIYTSTNYGRFHSNSHNYKAGLDYYINDKNTVGVMVQGVARDHDYNSYSLQKVMNPNEELDRYYKMNNNQTGVRNNINANLNYAFRNSEKETSLTWDVDYGDYRIEALRLYPYDYYSKDGVKTHSVAQKYDMPIDIGMFTTKMDYERPMLNGKFSTGFKLSNINTDNYQTTHWDKGTGWEYSPLESNEYNYKEFIQALYAQYQSQYKHINYYAGLRVENTLMKGRSMGKIDNGGTLEDFDSLITRSHLGLFPNVGMTFAKNPMNQWSINYSRRIDRPNYQDLNPFVFRVNDFIDRTGNGYLRPQISNKISVGHTYKYMINTRLEYTHTKDLFGELIDTSGTRLTQRKENINSVDIVSLNVSVPYRWNKLSVFTNVNAYYAMYKSDFGENRDLSLNVLATSVYGQVSYNVNSWLTAEVSGWYVSPSVFMGTFKAIGMGGIDAGLQARVFDNKGVLKLSVGDVFKTMKWGGSSDFAGQQVSAHGYWESQKLSLNFNYNFGNSKYKGKNRNTGNEDEKLRIEGDTNQGGMNNAK